MAALLDSESAGSGSDETKNFPPGCNSVAFQIAKVPRCLRQRKVKVCFGVVLLAGDQLPSQTCLAGQDHSKGYADTASTAVIVASVPFFHWHGQLQGQFQ